VIRNALGRFATLFTAASMAVMVLGVGAAGAAPPTWAINVDLLPPVVATDANAGYRVTISNNGTSNIVSLSLSSSVSDQPVYRTQPAYSSTSGGPGSCTTSGTWSCSLGTLPAMSSVEVIVAWSTMGSTNRFDVTFNAKTVGATESDGIKKKSRGDALSQSVSTTIAASGGDFDGGFALDATTFATNPSLGRRNIQATSVTTPDDQVIPATVRDGPGASSDPECPTATTTFGECSLLRVGEGRTFSAFKVVLLVLGNSVPGGVSTGDIDVFHTYADGFNPDGSIKYTTDIIGNDDGERCATEDDSSSAPCVFVTKVGSNYKIVVWLLRNGGLKGGI
jgi:hypothetical protein